MEWDQQHVLYTITQQVLYTITQHTTYHRVSTLTAPGSLQVAATILGGIFTKNTENNQFSPSNHQLYTGLQKIKVQLAVSQRSSLQGE